MNISTTLARTRQETCPHTSRITVRTNGIERQICEKCDHVSFAFSDEDLSEIDRDRFARAVDRPTSIED